LVHLFNISKEVNKAKLLWAVNEEDQVFFIDSNDYNKDRYHSVDWMLGIGCNNRLKSTANDSDSLQKLQTFHDKHKDWTLGYLSYELKDQIENLKSENPDSLGFSLLNFVIPEILFVCKKGQISVFGQVEEDHKKAKDLLRLSDDCVLPDYIANKDLKIENRMSRSEYISAVEKLLEHIQYGDIFEINFCQEFFAEDVEIDPVLTYLRLRKLSPTPFSSFIKDKGRYILSASPERYLKKEGEKLISQPIKGTIRRGKDSTEDELLIQQLQNDPKERGENLMIVDLVRNDLSITAQKGTVEVEELCGIYTYPQVHQMISTVYSKLSAEHSFTDAIKKSFPMGSMTGAPKVKAMELIEEYEKSKRGLFSGSVGYITPDGDFDFSVIIRSMLYNESNRYLSFTTGGAITRLSKPENEYEECMLKAEAMIKTLTY
jgi:para-aminobenzoate synthetase component 1